ncbi:MAG: DEAD/DEAH box helicase, partial [Alphaproteobacteria bacterium]|nr:DEAD/DEAH box helicase [Alphaproteobacteria bacterium]
MIDKNLLKKEKITIGNVQDGSYSYLLERIYESTTKDIIFLVEDPNRAYKLYKEIKFLNKNTLWFPEWDNAPYDLVSPSKAILEHRIKTLSKLNTNNHKIIVTTIGSFIQKTIPKDILAEHTISIKQGSIISRQKIIDFLIANNYSRLSEANEPGEFAVRGSIIDIFANGEDKGFRIDFFDNRVEFIKTFDPTTQTSIDNIDKTTILPASEFIFSQEYLNKLKESLLNIAGSRINDLDIIQNLAEGIKSNTIEQYIPLIYDCKNIDSYTKDPLFILDKFLDSSEKGIFDKIQNLYEERSRHTKLEKAILKPNKLWITHKEYQSKLKDSQTITLELSESTKQDTSLKITHIDNFKILAQDNHIDIIKTLSEYILRNYKLKKNVIISSSSIGSQDRIHRALKHGQINCVLTDSIPKKFTPQVHLITTPIEDSFSCPEYAFITEKNIFGETIQKITRKSKSNPTSFSDLSTFSLGELVVHNEYGVAKFCGLETIELSNTKHDCIKLEYSQQDKLFIPVENINLITRYGSADSTTQLDSLGTSSWQIKKGKAKEKIKKSAEYLMQIAAQRRLKQSDILEISSGLYEEFCRTFPYVETEDQLNAIEAIKTDLISGKPMDRLICGDTGFGKTEVALRAAFTAIKAGKQVSLVCPTTLLTKQHFRSFESRMSKFGIKTAQLSRLVSNKEAKTITENINNGNIDMVIG